MERKKNEEYKESQITAISILALNFYLKNYFLLESIIQKKAIYTITFYLQFSCVAGYLKRSNDTPKVNIHKYINYNIIEIYIYRLSTTIAIKNGNIVWKHGSHCWYSYLNLKFLRWPYREYIKIVKMAACSEDFLCWDDFDTVLAIFCSYRYGANISEAAEKIAITGKDYHKCCLCVTVCIITTY